MGVDNKKATITVCVNGEPRQAPRECTVRQLLEQLDVNPSHVVVELNGTIVNRDRIGSTPVPADARIEIVHFVGGG